MLELYRPETEIHFEQKPLLYSILSNFSKEYDPEFSPQPTSASQLPDLRTWTLKFGISVLEIYASRRQPTQLSRWCHRSIYTELLKSVGSQEDVGKIRKLYQSQPLDGISESTLTVRFGARVRALAIRFEGVDQRWLCTALELL